MSHTCDEACICDCEWCERTRPTMTGLSAAMAETYNLFTSLLHIPPLTTTRKSTEMPNNNLPDLSTWHLVPVGATLPKNTPYAYAYADRLTVELDGYPRDTTVSRDDCPYYTEHPITPPLPTEEGATIAASYDEWPPHILLTRKAGRWITPRYGDKWHVDQITAWAPVTIGEAVIMP